MGLFHTYSLEGLQCTVTDGLYRKPLHMQEMEQVWISSHFLLLYLSTKV